MNKIVNFRPYANKHAPTLVLLDLQRGYIATPRLFSFSDAKSVLENCKIALDYSRRVGLPVAFVRMVARYPFFHRALSYSKWIPGFEPVSSDMVFERDRPSCYASPEFANAMTEGGGHFVLAGFSGEAACLCTVVEAFHRDHKVTFLADASASHDLNDVSANVVHNIVVQIIGQFGDVATTSEWISKQITGGASGVL